jgi:hypothetical protein
MLMAAFQVLWEVMKDHEDYDAETHERFRNFVSGMADPIVMIGKDVFRSGGSVCSGILLTLMLNNILNSLYIRMAFLNLSQAYVVDLLSQIHLKKTHILSDVQKNEWLSAHGLASEDVPDMSLSELRDYIIDKKGVDISRGSRQLFTSWEEINELLLQRSPDGSINTLGFFDEHIRFGAMGDDHVNSFSSFISDRFWSFSRLQAFFAAIGVKVTPAKKDGDAYDYMGLDEISICKRRWKHGEGELQGKILAPIELPSILKMVSMGVHNDTLSHNEWSAAPLNKMLFLEVMMHGPDVFAEFFQEANPLVKWMRTQGIRIYSYHECVNMYLNQEADWAQNVPPLDWNEYDFEMG